MENVNELLTCKQIFVLIFVVFIFRFCPSVLFYLMSVVPCLWLLELARLDHSMILANQRGLCNGSSKSINNISLSVSTMTFGNSTNSGKILCWKNSQGCLKIVFGPDKLDC